MGKFGTFVYVRGYMWHIYRSITWEYDPSNPFVSQNTRFFGGNLNAGSAQLAIHDLPIYDYALTGAQVMALSNGRSGTC